MVARFSKKAARLVVTSKGRMTRGANPAAHDCHVRAHKQKLIMDGHS